MNVMPPFDLKKVALIEVGIAALVVAIMFMFYFPKGRQIKQDIRKLNRSAGQYASISEADLKKKEQVLGLSWILCPYRDEKVIISEEFMKIGDVMGEKVWIKELVFDASVVRRKNMKNEVQVIAGAYTGDRVKDMLAVNEMKRNIALIPCLKKNFERIDIVSTSTVLDRELDLEYTEFVLRLGQDENKREK